MSSSETSATPSELPNLAHVPPEDRDRVWFETYYQGERMPQLTVRAVVMGGVIGMAMSVSNLYTTLKLGWAFGVAITACVMSYAIWNTFVGMGLAKSKMSILENNCMQSTASAAGYSTGGTIATAAGALLLITGDAGRMGWVPLTIWVFLVAILGVFLAIPMKRQMINQEQLPFPSGIAAAETLRSLYAEGEEATKKARDLIDAMIVGGLVGIGRSWALIPEALSFSGAISSQRGALPLGALGVSFEPSILLVAAGAITGMRVCASMLLGALLNWFVFAPWVISRPDWVDPVDQPRPGMIAVHVDELGVAGPAPVVTLSGPEGPVTVTLADDGVWPDLHPGDGTWATLASAPGDQYTATLKVGDRTIEGGSHTWAADNQRRDLGFALSAAGATGTAGEAPPSGKHYAGDFEVRKDAETGAFTSINVRKWSLWLGTALLVSSGLTAFALNWRTILRAIVGARSGRAKSALEEQMAAIEVPTSWMVMGLVPTTIGLIAVCWLAMGIHPALGLLSVALSGVLALVACRATGETDTTPIGAMGKITQFIYAVLSPADKTVNLMTAGVTAGAAGSSADLLTDLKSGYLLGANPRKQFLAQFYGVFFGIVAVVPAWYLMVPDKAALEAFNSPATTMWYAVAQALANGVESIPLSARYGIVFGGLAGILLPLTESLFPKTRRFLPSSMGLGLAFVITFSNALGFFLGALLAERWVRRSPDAYENKIIPLASGAIAGESLVSAGYAMLNSLGILANE